MLPYHPALRFKQGEYTAGAKIAKDIQKYVQPRFIIPPPQEVDPEKGRALTVDEIAYLTGERLGKFWPFLTAFLDAQYIAPHLGDAGLEKMFKLAQQRNDNLAVVCTISDLSNPVFRSFLRPVFPRIGIYLPYEDVDAQVLLDAIKQIGCEPEECVIFLDFTGASLDVENAASSVAGVLDILGMSARWGRIVFQGSSFPTTNPAGAGSDFLIPRHEWNVFTRTVKECSVPPEIIGYGDYGADCGEIKFPRKSGGGRAIRHLRYTGKNEMVVVRGASEGKDHEIMQGVCERIVSSTHFAGQGFSYADNKIWRVAKSIDGPGNASMWREWNMAHHLTRVVRDLGAISGILFDDVQTTKVVEQNELFDSVDS